MSDDEHVELYEGGPKTLLTARVDVSKRVKTKGYTGWKRQVHHVLPVASLHHSKEEFIADQDEPRPTRRGLERITKYDVNEDDNLIGLPSSKVYAAKYCKKFSVVPKVSKLVDSLKKPEVAACDWPIHLWNHPKYNSKAQAQTDEVWDNLALTIENHKPVSAKDLGSTIRNVSKGLEKGLKNSAKKKKRTQEAWQNGDKAAFDII